MGDPDIEALSPLFKKTNHPAGSIEAEGASTREKDGMDPLHDMDRIEGINLAGPGGRTPDIHTPYRSFFTKDHRAAGHGLKVSGMTYTDPLYIGYGSYHLFFLHLVCYGTNVRTRITEHFNPCQILRNAGFRKANLSFT
jgi:hypothetical protein